MIREHSGQINQRYNPTKIQFDEHGSTKIAIKAVFGQGFLETHTLGFDYHVDRSVKTHKKYFNSKDCVLVNALKNSVTEDGYNQEKKKRLSNLISKQPEFCQRPLTDMLNFWDNVKY